MAGKKMDKKEIRERYKRTPPDMGVYLVKNLANGKIYIGRAMDLQGKLNSERFQLRNDLHRNKELQQDFNTLGMDHFAFEVLDRLAVKEAPGYDYSDDLRTLEALWLEKLQPYAAGGYQRPKP
jgi:hypothetical protein